jgi:Transcriptional regulator, AbiEi antitoxin
MLGAWRKTGPIESGPNVTRSQARRSYVTLGLATSLKVTRTGIGMMRVTLRTPLLPDRDLRPRRLAPWRRCSAVGTLGPVKWRQLREAGVGANAIKRRANSGHLHRIHRGVYIVGHTALAPYAREHAALLACGQSVLISHWSAAYLWGMIAEPPSQIHVSVVGRRCRPKAGVRIHVLSEIDRSDVRRRQGIPVTAPARTAIDLAADASNHQLEAVVAEARVRKLVRDGELEKALARAGQRRGVGAMRSFLRHEGGPALATARLRAASARGAAGPGDRERVVMRGLCDRERVLMPRSRSGAERCRSPH